MKKLLILSAAGLCVFAAHSQAFEMGKSYVSIGYGTGNFTQAVIKAAAAGSDVKFRSLGPAFIKYEYAIAENVGIGVNFAYLDAKVTSDASYQDDNNNTVNYIETVKFTTWSALGRVNYHFSDNETVDPYMGIGMGYRSGKWAYENSDPNAPQDEDLNIPSPFGMDLTFGTRFMFTPNFGVYAEVGIAKAVIQGGFALKF